MSKKQEIAISIRDIHKEFILPQNRNTTFKQTVVNIIKKNRTVTQKVLDGVSFNVNKGDFFGIVGCNGSGKSTLLKLIAGVYTPTAGAIEINGGLTPFIELGVGFNPELSGRDNVFLNGALLGFNRKQMEAMYDDIVAFAELEPFMDQKLKNYSSGMQVRLAFSIAIKAENDIMIFDEVLAVGDEAFQRKCYSYFSSLKKGKKTVILVTHSMDVVQQFCNRAVMIEFGKVSMIGNPVKIAQKYREINAPEEDDITIKEHNVSKNKNIEAKIDHNFIDNDKYIIFNISLKPLIDIDDPVITFGINRDNGEEVYRWVTDEKIKDKIFMKKNNKYDLSIKIRNIFPDSKFGIQLGVKKRDRTYCYMLTDDIDVFDIVTKGLYEHNTRWKPEEVVEYSWRS